MELLLRLTLLLIILELITIDSLAQVVPQERSVDWSPALNSYTLQLPSRQVNVKDFDAAGDGKSNDQPAVVEAISSLNGEPGIVYFPEGIYMLSGPVSLGPAFLLQTTSGAA